VLYGITRGLSRIAGSLVWRWKVSGAAAVPRGGGVILAANHQSYLDVLLVGAACPRPVRYLARRSLWDARLLGWIITDWRAIPVNRESPGKDELRGIVETVRSGEVLALFPEGTRTRDGSVGELRGGVGFLARRAGVPVVPVLIQGAFEAWPRERRLPGRGRVRIAFGRPVKYPDSWEDREVAADIRRRLLALRDGPDEPRPGRSPGRAACAPRGGEGAA
jgi:1-acyl-sn-glycerol-3-phosphate acyltransferase